MTRQLAYCTNVHAGSDLDALRANLAKYCLAVKDRFAPERPMGVGLWIAAPAARKLLESRQLAGLSAWLADHGLVPFTLNGFPYGDFHEPVVKHRVYRPTWFDSQRLDYTLDLVEILNAILPDGMDGSISTLPIAWRSPPATDQQQLIAARHLVQVAEQLARLEENTGRLITVCLEPEPGCLIQRSEDVLRFFGDFLCTDGGSDMRKRYIRVCHDICHSAVMFEDQREVLRQYAQEGIQVGKVQVSSAVEADFDQAQSVESLIEALRSFAEDRYLHQTVIRTSVEDRPVFHEDLPLALAAAAEDRQLARGQWRVHFHVPIYLQQFGVIGTTQDQIHQCLEATDLHPELKHFEVETYAWGVLPAELRRAELADGIAQELQWMSEFL